MKVKTQKGLVAIMVTSVIMVLMSLITLGFSRIVSREQRQGLDNQLSTQAFYAAESGVNAVAERISATGVPSTEKTDCDVAGLGNGEIDPATPEVRYTCIMYDPTPSSIEFNNGTIRAERSKVVPILASPTPSTLTFRWSDNAPANVNFDSSCSVGERLAASGPQSWGSALRIGMLQIDLIPVPSGNLTRSGLDNSTATILMHPCGATAPSSVPFENYRANNASGIERGRVTGVNCTNAVPYRCSLGVTGLPAVPFYVRIKSIYSSLNVEITGQASDGTSVNFANAQMLVDSTGRANDVVRRVQVRLPLYGQYDIPEASIQSQAGVCKLLRIQNTTVTSDPLCS